MPPDVPNILPASRERAVGFSAGSAHQHGRMNVITDLGGIRVLKTPIDPKALPPGVRRREWELLTTTSPLQPFYRSTLETFLEPDANGIPRAYALQQHLAPVSEYKNPLSLFKPEGTKGNLPHELRIRAQALNGDFERLIRAIRSSMVNLGIAPDLTDPNHLMVDHESNLQLATLTPVDIRQDDDTKATDLVQLVIKCQSALGLAVGKDKTDATALNEMYQRSLRRTLQ